MHHRALQIQARASADRKIWMDTEFVRRSQNAELNRVWKSAGNEVCGVARRWKFTCAESGWNPFTCDRRDVFRALANRFTRCLAMIDTPAFRAFRAERVSRESDSTWDSACSRHEPKSSAGDEQWVKSSLLPATQCRRIIRVARGSTNLRYAHDFRR